jgi:hypothetical protein
VSMTVYMWKKTQQGGGWLLLASTRLLKRWFLPQRQD